MLITSLLHLRKQAELYQIEDFEVYYTLRHVRDFCSLCILSWLILDIPPGGLSDLQCPEIWSGLLNRLIKISSSLCSDSQKSLPVKWSSWKLWSLCQRLWNYILSIKLPILDSWHHIRSFFCMGATSEN